MFKISAQVSLYPLGPEDLSPAIEEVVRIFQEFELDAKPGPMSTLITSDDE